MSITEAETMVRAELGADYIPVKLGGAWIISRYSDGRKVSGPLAQSRSLSKAVAAVKATV